MRKPYEGDLPDSVFQPGSHIDDDLTVLDHLGGTRKVDVYLCRSKRLKRQVACKMLLPGKLDDNIVREGLLKEGGILQQMRHPNVIEGYGVYLEPCPRIVIEFLEGQNLKTTFFVGNYEAFDLKDFIDIAIQLSDALSYVHHQGFLHLDVKPQNVFYCDDYVKLIDFSLAQRFSPDSPLKRRSGTAGYMAPEQTYRQYLSYATDVFGLGVTFYQLLTGGKRPYEVVKQLDKDGNKRSQTSYEAPVQPPSKLNPSVTHALEQIALMAIHLDIDQRFQTPADFKAALLNAI